MAELLVRRARDAKHFDLAPGIRRAVFAPHQHYQDDQGDWQDVALDFEPQGGGVHLVTKHLLNYRADATGLSVFHKPTGRGIKFVFPRVPDRVLGRAAEWDLADGTTWRLAARKTGLKTTANIVARRGPKTYRFDAEMLGGLAAPTEHASGALVSPHFVIPRSTVHSADGKTYPCGAWRLQGGEARFDFDDGVLPDEALPYVIDPTTTFNVAASGDDGYAERGQQPEYPPPSGIGDNFNIIETLDAVHKIFDDVNYTIRVALMRWDTSSIPNDATITSAVVRLRIVGTAVSDDARDFVAEYYDAGTIDMGDYTDTVTSDAHAGTAIESITVNADNDFALTNLENISKTGITGLRWHVSGDDPPTLLNDLIWASFDHATLAAPRLLVDYTEEGTFFSVAASGDDGIVTALGDETWPPEDPPVAVTNGTTIRATKYWTGTLISSEITVAILRFDTSALPDDAVVTSAILRLWITNKVDLSNRSLAFDWYGSGASIDAADYSTNGAAGTAHAGTDIGSIVDDADNDFVLTALENISLAGVTGLRVHITGGQPGENQNNQVDFASFDHGTLVEPRLIIEFTEEPSAPTLRTVQSNLGW